MNSTRNYIKYMLTDKCEKIIIAEGKQTIVIKEKKSYSLSEKPLSKEEFSEIQQDFETLFKGKNTINISGKNISLLRETNSLILSVIIETEKLDVINFLKMMIDKNASDLHLSSNCKPILRIDGDIETLDDFPIISENKLLQGLIEITPKVNIDEFNKNKDTDFAYEIKGLARFRVNIFLDRKGICVVFRAIPSEILTVQQLNLSEVIIKLCDKPKGLILVTGPTGCGKSTTLATLIDYINKTQKKHIITIEDPIEFVHENKMSLINQREVKTHTISFKKALRAALREDPDVVLVGEMRDLETTAIAIETAVTGHLVFGTLHTSTAVATVDRMVDQFSSERQEQIRMMCADALIGVISQVLCKKIGRGRVAAYEVLIITHSISNLIREKKTFQIPSLMQTGKGFGMKLINDSLVELVEKKLIEPKEAIDKAIEKENIIKILETKGFY